MKSDTVTIEYPPNWPGPEAGTTAVVDIGASPAQPGSPAAGRGEPTGPLKVVSAQRTPDKPKQTAITTIINIPTEIKPYTAGNNVDIVGVADEFNRTGNQRLLEAARRIGIEDQDFEAATKFARDHIRVLENHLADEKKYTYIPVDDWNELPTNIQNTIRDKSLFAGRGQIKREGRAVAQRTEDVAAIKADIDRQTAALKQLETTRSTITEPGGAWYSIKTGKTISENKYKALNDKAKRDFVRNLSGLGGKEIKDPSGNYDFEKMAAFIRDNPEGEKIIKDANFKDSETLIAELNDFNKRIERANTTIYQNIETGKTITAAQFKSLKGKDRDYYRLSPETGVGAKFRQGTTIAAEVVVPGIWAKRWGKLSDTEKGLYIATDAAALLFIGGAAVRGARAAGAITRMGTLKGALAGVAGEVGAQVAAPVNMVIHPLKSVKAAGRTIQDLVENVISPRKASYLVVTTTDGTVRIPTGLFKTEADAMAARDTIMKLAKAGPTRIQVEAGDYVIDVARSPLMKEAGGGLVHSTPDIEILQGAKITPKPGMVEKEQGWFLSHEPLPRFVERTAFGKGEIPAPVKAGGVVDDISRYRPAEVVRLDKTPVRDLNFADANNIPADLAKPLESYAKKNNAILYGSFNEWLKLEKPVKPNDFDLVFRNADKAIDDIVDIAKRKGYNARAVKHGVEIEINGKWVKLGDIVSMSQHKAMLPLPVITNKIGGLKVETLGKQYIGQAYGAIAGDAKAGTRAKKLELAADEVKNTIVSAGLKPKKRGFIIIGPESAEQAVSTEKLYAKSAELESKYIIGARVPKIRQKLYTRVGPNLERAEIWLENPLSIKSLAKLRADGIIEAIKAPFRPAIRIKGLSKSQLRILEKELEAAGNGTQARALRHAYEMANAKRIAPPVGRIGADVSRKRIEAAQRRIINYIARNRPDLVKDIDRIGRVIERERIVGREKIDAFIKRLDRTEKDARGRAGITDSRGRVGVTDSRGRIETADSRGRRIPTEPREPRGPREPIEPREPRIPRIPREPDKGKPPPPTRFSPGMSRKQKITTIKEAGGAVSRRQGELQGQDLWHVWKYPYQSKDDYTLMRGDPPPGSRPIKGIGSAKKSSTLLYGKPPEKDTTFDMGFQDVTITTTGDVIFKADPKQLTRNISLSNRKVFPLPRG